MLDLPLDENQVRQIERTHRGFLFQHLFAVACVMRNAGSPGFQVIVEHDEDVEIITASTHIYIQVKTRTGTLYESELDSFFTRAQQLFREHATGNRDGNAEVWLATNATIGDAVRQRLSVANVDLWSPSHTTKSSIHLPPPFATLAAAFSWCVEAATAVALTRLSPETLVWKLAAVVAYRATGTEHNHTIEGAEIEGLYELFVEQLHRFPEIPRGYRPQDGEPPFDSEQDVALVVATSGAGKTAWASHGAIHTARDTVYFDTAGLPDSAVPSALLREAIAQLLVTDSNWRNDLNPGAGGLDGLRALSLRAARGSVRPIVVVDNVHAISPGMVTKLVESLRGFRCVLLGQPSPHCAILETLLSVTSVRLHGWSLLTIAAVFDAEGMPVEPTTAARITRLTGGMPRFVINAALLSSETYGNQPDAFCQAIETGTNVALTAQELILQQTYAQISGAGTLTAAILSLAPFPLTQDEVIHFCAGHESLRTPQAAVSALRELYQWGIINRLQSGAIFTHDVFRMLSQSAFAALSPAFQLEAKTRLAMLIESTIGPGQVDRLMTLCRLLPAINRTGDLAEITSSLCELIHEQGRAAELQNLLEEALATPDLPPRERFLLADTIALWEYYLEDKSPFARRVRQMERLASESPLSPEDYSRLLLKQLLEAGRNDDVQAIKRISNDTGQLTESPVIHRIISYNTAVAFFVAGRVQETLPITERLIEEYFVELRLSSTRLVGQSAIDLATDLGDDPDRLDEAKRLADVLDLRARALNEAGYSSGLCRLHALKFYQVTHNLVSTMKVGQDVVDEYISMMDDYMGARQLLEQLLLPIVKEYRLHDYVIPVQGQYAVVLAYCGEVDAARILVQQLEAFAANGMTSAELEGRKMFIEQIAIAHRSGLPPARIQVDLFPDDRCPCGSGKKFRICHGR